MFVGDLKELERELKVADSAKRDVLLKEVESDDIELAQSMRIKYVNIEDLVYLDSREYLGILQGIDVFDLGMALRMGSKALKHHIVTNSPGAAKVDIESIINGPPQERVNVLAAIDRILKVVRNKLEKGEISIDPNDELV